MDQAERTVQDTQIIEFLASGMPGAEVAAMCAISTDYITTKLQDSVFRDLIKERGQELRELRVQTSYAKTEEKILKRIEKEAEDDMADLPVLVRALEVVAKNRVLYRNPAGLGQPAHHTQQTHLHLYMPARVQELPPVTLNSNSEIVAVGNRNMAGAPIEAVQKLFASMTKGTTHETETIDYAAVATSA